MPQSAHLSGCSSAERNVSSPSSRWCPRYCLQLFADLSFQSDDHNYGLDYLTGGLVYLPSGTGGILAAYVTGRILDRDYDSVARIYGLPVDSKSINANNLMGYPIEKARLRSAFVILTISLVATIGYGWALQQRTHIAVPLVLQFFTGSTQVAIFVVIGTLLTDLNPDRSATVQASYNLVRCGLSAAGIAALQAGIDGIGVGWIFTVYGLLAFCCIPLCWWLQHSGWEWRKAQAAAQAEPAIENAKNATSLGVSDCQQKALEGGGTVIEPKTFQRSEFGSQKRDV